MEGEGGITYSRDVYSTREDPTERLLDMRELAKVTLFSGQLGASELPCTCSSSNIPDMASSATIFWSQHYGTYIIYNV